MVFDDVDISSLSALLSITLFRILLIFLCTNLFLFTLDDTDDNNIFDLLSTGSFSSSLLSLNNTGSYFCLNIFNSAIDAFNLFNSFLIIFILFVSGGFASVYEIFG